MKKKSNEYSNNILSYAKKTQTNNKRYLIELF